MYASGRASIAICDRCSFKYPYMALRADGNSPGLRVCDSCWDQKNPWRLPPIKIDAITLRWPRPDIPLDSGVSYPDYTNPPAPVPPAFNFAAFEGLEGGIGAIQLEGGIGVIQLESGSGP